MAVVIVRAEVLGMPLLSMIVTRIGNVPSTGKVIGVAMVTWKLVVLPGTRLTFAATGPPPEST